VLRRKCLIALLRHFFGCMEKRSGTGLYKVLLFRFKPLDVGPVLRGALTEVRHDCPRTNDF
jgi:hypothetical protein